MHKKLFVTNFTYYCVKSGHFDTQLNHRNPANRRGFAFLGEAMQQPYFFNPGMTTQQLEDWLGQQKIYLAHFNRLIAEKAALEERLSQISAEIGRVATGSFEGMLSFPWDPSPLVENPQQDSGQSAD
ncbi:hypothetical protein POY30_00505 [Klebsiella pneumoniae]